MDVKRSSSGSTAAEGKRSRASDRSGAGASAATTVARKEVERKRRQHMKSLCAKLTSLIPKEHYSSKDKLTRHASLDEAAAYIKKLKERVDELQQKRSSAQLLAGMRGGASTSAATMTSSGAGLDEEADVEALEAAAPPPVVEVRQNHDGSSLDVVLVSSVARPFKMHEVVTVLEEEGAEVINANFSVVAGRQIFYTIHSRAFSSRIGIEVSRVSERLRALV